MRSKKKNRVLQLVGCLILLLPMVVQANDVTLFSDQVSEQSTPKENEVLQTSESDSIEQLESETTDSTDSNLSGESIDMMDSESVKSGDVDSEDLPNQSKKSLPDVSYTTHIENRGWISSVKGGHIAGTVGQGLRLEGIKMNLTNLQSSSINYSVHVQDIGWMAPVKDGDLAGTTGRAKRLEAIKINLSGQAVNQYDIYYRVHVQNLGWLDWASNGEKSGSSGFGYRLEAIEIKLFEKNQSFPGKVNKPFVKAPPSISYESYLRGRGWQGAKNNGTVSGTTGQARKIEALKMNLFNKPESGSIQYQVHIENKGWLNPVTESQTTGFPNANLKIEALMIQLTGTLAKQYDIYYRAHVQNIGWLGWASNGEKAGTSRMSKPIEAYQIVIREKNQGAPGVNQKPPFYSGSVSESTANGRFINQLAPYVQAIAPKYDLFSSVMIAQACLESDYGRSTLAKSPNNNLYGIKGDYQGAFVIKETLEDDGKGHLHTVKAKFRKYPSQYESCLDYANKIKYGVSWDPVRYRGVWRSVAGNYQNATKALTGTYATDTKYNIKLNNLIQTWHLEQFDY